MSLKRSSRLLRRLIFTVVAFAIILFCIGDLLVLSIADISFAQSVDEPDAELGSPPYGGMDLVFLVDQSGSMRTNDPDKMRATIIRWVLGDLGIDNLFSRKQADHRIGIVSFGDGARVDLPLVSLKVANEIAQGAPTEEQIKLFEKRYSELEPQVKADNLGATDVLKGLEMVNQVFTDAEGQEKSTGPRTKGVIILTDGPPYREGWQSDPQFAGTNFYNPYFSLMREYVQDNLPLALQDRATDGYHIYVLGLNRTAEIGDTPPPGASWPELEARWQSVVGPGQGQVRVIQVPTQDQSGVPPLVIQVLHRMMVGGVCDNRLENTRTAEVPEQPLCLLEDNFVVPPYLSQAIFTVFEPQSRIGVQFTQPNGQVLDLAGDSVTRGVQAGRRVEVINVDNPQPGAWQWQKLASSPEVVTVHFRPLFNQIALDDAFTYSDLFDSVQLAFHLRGLDGRDVPELPQYPIRAVARIVFPDGVSQELDLESNGSGVLTARQRLLLDQPGRYVGFLTGTATGPDGNAYTIFRDERLEFTVGSLEPMLVHPEPAQPFPLFHSAPIQLQLNKPDGSVPSGSNQNAVVLSGSLHSPDGATSQLTFSPGSTPNAYASSETFTGKLPGNYEVDAKGSMAVGDQIVDLFDESMRFSVDDITVDYAAPSGDQPQNGIIDIEVLIENESGGGYEEHADSPWAVTSSIEGPDGSIQEKALSPEGNGRYLAQFVPDVPGEWKIKTSAMVRLPDGAEVNAFDSLERTLQVYPTTVIALQLLNPEAGASQWIRRFPRILPLPEHLVGKPTNTVISAQITDTNGRAIPVTEIASDPSQAIAATLRRPGTSIPEPVTLSPSPQDPSILQASLPDLTDAGDYELSIGYGNTRREYLPEPSSAQQITFSRIDPLSVLTYVLLAIELLLLVVILYLIAHAIVIRINPVMGRLEFEGLGGSGGGRSLGTLLLTSYRKNTFTIDQRTIATQLDPAVSEAVKRLKIKNASQRSAKRRGPEDDLGMGGGAAAIKIWGWDSSGGEFLSGEELPDNMSTILSDGINVRYHHE